MTPSATDPGPISRPTPTRASRQSALAGFLRWVAVLMVLFALVVSGYYLYFNVINRPPAEVYIVSRGTATSAVYGTVTITSNGTITLTAQNSGYLHYAPDFLKNTVQVNGLVVKNQQLLGTVVDEVGLRQLDAARRDYESALSRQKVGPANAGPLQSAQSKLDVLKKLKPESVPKLDIQTAESEVERLKAAVQAEKLDFQHAVDVTSTALKTYEDQLKRTEIRAPFDGIMTALYNDNSYVTTNSSLFTVSYAQTYVSGEVNEEDVGGLRRGMKAEVKLYAYSNTTFDATLTDILPSPVANSSRYTVTLNLDKPPDNLMFGLTGEMNIILGRKPNAIIVPSRAINIDQALIVDDGVVETRTVKVGFRSLDFTEVLDGINEGDEVIVSDQDAFKPGERVRAVKTNVGKVKK